MPGELIEPPVDVDPSAIALPLCESYVSVNEFAVHFAYSVRSVLVVSVPLPATYVVPEPSAEVFQPAKL